MLAGSGGFRLRTAALAAPLALLAAAAHAQPSASTTASATIIEAGWPAGQLADPLTRSRPALTGPGVQEVTLQRVPASAPAAGDTGRAGVIVVFN